MITYYILYQITNLVNGKIYVGVHTTSDLNDGYMGSGKVIRSAIGKHGVENFTKVILETFENSEAMYAREKEIVNDEFLLREDTYNLRRGGTGGFDYINKSGLAPRNPWSDNCRILARHALNKITTDQWSKMHRDRYATVPKETKRSWNEPGRIAAKTATANEKRRKTMSVKQAGEKNSQFGTMWITNGHENRKIKNTDLIPEGCNKGRK